MKRHDLHVAELDHVAFDLDAERCEKLLRDRPAGDAGGGLASRGSFENIAQVADTDISARRQDRRGRDADV